MATAVIAPPRPIVAGASVTGPSHARRGQGCQDAYAADVDADGRVLIAVADGLGSARYASVGATAGAATAVRAARALLLAAPDAPLPWILTQAVACARLSIARAAVEAAAPLSGFACTLLVAIASREATCCAHIGDGAVIVLDDDLRMLSGPGESEYVEVTDPLTAPDWRARVRVSPVVAGVRAIAVLTDGVQRAAIAPDGTPGRGFCEPVFSHVRARGEDARADLEALLAGPKLNEHSDDDKTLVVATM